ncbi:MAG: BrnA antitoxin family protein [Propionivibrio sp.]|nr:BrnA antitoxin family protein [Propionivibrio sp.]
MQVRSKTRVFDVPTQAEDDAITVGALSDPDNPPLTDAQLSQFKRLRGQRGPQKTPVKCQVTLRLDPEVVDFYKATGRGWQGRINDALVGSVKAKKKTAA